MELKVYNAGCILRKEDLVDPSSARVSKRMKGEASEVVKVISEIIGLPHEEVQEHLQRIQGSIYHLELLVRMQESTVPYDKQEGIHGESTSLFTGIDDADVEDEYNKIEMEVGSGTSQLCSSEVVVTSAKAKTEDHKTSESLSDALSNLSLVDSTPMEPVTLDSMKRTRKSFNDLQLESTWLRLLSFLTIRF